MTENKKEILESAAGFYLLIAGVWLPIHLLLWIWS